MYQYCFFYGQYFNEDVFGIRLQTVIYLKEILLYSHEKVTS